jgi:hypothetical protein
LSGFFTVNGGTMNNMGHTPTSKGNQMQCKQL